MSAVESIAPQGAELEQTKTLGEFVAGLKRQRKTIAVVALSIFFVGVLAALFWPPTYGASATVLIEEQEVPQDMVRSTITSYANQQIEVIRQRVLTMKNIMEIVRKFELYDEDELARTPRTEIATDFIEAVKLDVLSADVIDPRSGRPTQATIAFTIDFQGEGPTKVLNVTNELVNLFLNENLRNRTAKASSTADFLRQEAEGLSEEVGELETALAQFKAQHKEALPESFQLNLQNLTRAQTQLLSSESQLRELTKREMSLDAQLVSTNAYAPTVLPDGETVLASVDRLRALQSQYRATAARYSQEHPDVVRLRREIDALASEVGHAGNRDDLQQLLKSRKAELVGLKANYAADHPEVRAQELLIRQLEQQVAKSSNADPDIKPDNPAYVYLDNQLQSLRMEKQVLTDSIASLKDQIEVLNLAAAKAPVVEREYNNILRNREVATAKYIDLKVKLREAELAGQLEQGRKGQRFTLIEPPTLPEQPRAPNRLAIVFLATILALGAGLAMALIRESLDQGIRGERTLGALMGAAPLVTIGYIQTPEEIVSGKPDKKIYLGILIAVVGAALVLLCIHLFYKPLDVLWYVFLNKLGAN